MKIRVKRIIKTTMNYNDITKEFEENFISTDVTGGECWSLRGRAVWAVKDFLAIALRKAMESVVVEEGTDR